MGDERFQVVRVNAVSIKVDPRPWEFALRRAADIARHWAQARHATPALFDGTIYMLRDHSLVGGRLTGTVQAVPFSSYLLWRAEGYSDATAYNAFGSAILRSREGHVMLVRAAPGTVNDGRLHLPGGFIDARDIGGEGMVDIEASVCRELEEETGLDTATLTRTAGFIVTSAGPIVSIGIEFRSGLAAEALCDRILAHAAQAAEAEIAGVVPVMPEEAGALDSNCVEFIRPLIRHLRGSA